jgi:hypothetical protein
MTPEDAFKNSCESITGPITKTISKQGIFKVRRAVLFPFSNPRCVLQDFAHLFSSSRVLFYVFHRFVFSADESTMVQDLLDSRSAQGRSCGLATWTAR